jgi:hypothetical protein
MTYNSNTPLASERISDTQQPIRDNFFLANQYFGVDHFEFDAVSNNGLHKQSTYPDRSATPPAPGVSECAIYGRTAGGETFPFLRRDGGTVDFPVAAIRAMVRVSTAPAVIGQSFNIDTALITFVGDVWTIPFLTPEADANYLILASSVSAGGASVALTSQNITANNFQIRRQGPGVSQVMVIVYRYSL